MTNETYHAVARRLSELKYQVGQHEGWRFRMGLRGQFMELLESSMTWP